MTTGPPGAAAASERVADAAAVSAWAADVVERVAAAFGPAAVPADAAPMAAYMKGVAPFLGIKTPARRAAQRDAWQNLGRPRQADVAAAADLLWARPEREYQYAACDLLAWYVPKVCRPPFLAGAVQPLIVAKSWWDTVDSLRSAAVGPLVARHPELVAVIRSWSESGNVWLVRSAIIHQLGRKATTDEALLFELCARHGADRECVVAKAIGWALREHARRAPDAVRAFVAATPLQNLSVREATKHL